VPPPWGTLRSRGMTAVGDVASRASVAKVLFTGMREERRASRRHPRSLPLILCAHPRAPRTTPSPFRPLPACAETQSAGYGDMHTACAAVQIGILSVTLLMTVVDGNLLGVRYGLS
jgi:hypothetical protein